MSGFLAKPGQEQNHKKKRYTNRLHGVFDLPHSPGLTSEGTEPARVMMSYERTEGSLNIEILDKDLSADVRKYILSWLQKISLSAMPWTDRPESIPS